MKKIIFICLLIIANFGFADSHFLNVTSEGLNLLITPKKNTVYPIAGIQVLTPGVTVQSGCKKYPNGFCIFNTRKGKVTQLTMSRSGKFSYVMCLNAIDHLQCQYYGSTVTDAFSKIYIASAGSGGTGYITYCPLTNGNVDSASCQMAPTSLTGGEPYYLSINKPAKKIYFSHLFGGSGNSVTTCSLNNQGAIISPCTEMDIFSSPSGVLYNAGFNKLYVANTLGNNVSVCTLRTNGTILSCTIKSGFITPTDIAINNTSQKIYITNKNDGSIAICNLNSAGTITTCPLTTPPNSFNNPDGIAINTKVNKVYIANNNSNSVSTCQLAANGAISLGTCTSKTGFNFPRGIAFNTAANKLYVADAMFIGAVSVCNVNSAGVIGACPKLTDGFVFPTGVTIN